MFIFSETNLHCQLTGKALEPLSNTDKIKSWVIKNVSLIILKTVLIGYESELCALYLSLPIMLTRTVKK